MKQDFLEDELYHHGIIGQKWGERRYQNPDGSLTPEGRVHLGIGKPRGLRSFRLETKEQKMARKREKLLKLREKNAAKKAKQEAKHDEKWEKEVQKIIEKEKKAIAKREAKDKKKMDPQKNENLNTYESSLEKSGFIKNYWDDVGSPKGSMSKDIKLGDNKATFTVLYNGKDKDPTQASSDALKTQSRYENEYKKVLSTTKEALAKDLYETKAYQDMADDYGINTGIKNKDDFKNSVSIQSIQVDPKNPNIATIYFSDKKDLFYDSTPYFTYDIDKDKVLDKTKFED